MHLTEVLYRQNVHRALKRFWKIQGKMGIGQIEIPPELQELGVKIYNANELFGKPEKIKINNKIIKTINDPKPEIVYSKGEKKYYLFDNKVRVTESDAQVLALTKTLMYEGLPPLLKSMVGLEQIPNQDELVQTNIFEALIKDGQQVKLPKKVDIKRPGYNFPREYSVRYKRKSGNILEKLHFLAEMGIGKYVESWSRGKVSNAFSETGVKRDGDDVIFKILGDILITSDTPLKPFASHDEVESTKEQELLSIYPIKPTLDLWQSETSPIRENNDIDTDVCTSTKQHIHTLHIVHRTFGWWFEVQTLSRAICGCFSFATQEARRLYGHDVKELPAPLCVQCIYSDIKSFGFLAFQLNTLDLSHHNGIKNQVWVDGPQQLYDEIDETKGITNYNADIFSKILAFYLNGVHPNSL